MSISARDRLSAWAPVVVWAAVIFYMSTDEMSAEHTRPWLEGIVRFFLPSVSDAFFDVLHMAVRKLAHVSEYFVLALFVDRGLRRGSTLSPARAPLTAFVLSALYSLSDEGHQVFVATRTASLLDCGLDSIGAGLAALRMRGRSYLG